MERQEYTHCIKCGKKLKTQEARKRGMGRICFEKFKEDSKKQRLFEMKLEQDTSNEEELCKG